MQEAHSKMLADLRSRLIVSVQADAGDPLDDPSHLAAMARAVVKGGAAAVRACQRHNIETIMRAIEVPVIGLAKQVYPDAPVFITPTRVEALEIAATGCDIIALDATQRPRPGGAALEEIVASLRRITPAMLMADVATLAEGIAAAEMGFDIVSSTLSGYTAETAHLDPDQPDFDLVEALVRELGGVVAVIAEGKIWEPVQARRMLDLGAHAVVVGTAITRPANITRRFAEALAC